MNQSAEIYREMAKRTGSGIYVGVVGPVRTGKSTFIKRFMEQLVLPNIENVYRRDRARDELPQSGSGRTIMTAEPKFVPEEAAEVRLADGTTFSVRLVDCVGYMVPGAVGQFEDLSPRMVMTPWFDHAIPMPEAAEIGTRKVITEHATVAVVVTTDGSVTDLDREEYLEAEERVIRELQALGKPFVVLLNSAQPQSAYSQSLAEDIRQRYGVCCMCANCQELEKGDLDELMRALLNEFPLKELALYLPARIDALPSDHPIKSGIYQTVTTAANELYRVRDVEAFLQQLRGDERLQSVQLRRLDLGTGCAAADGQIYRELFYETLSQQTGLSVRDDGDLVELLAEMARLKTAYGKVAPALQAARETGYGIVMPEIDELDLEDPEIIRQGGRYGLRMKASAPSIHMIRADIATTVSPIVGNEKQSEDMVNYLLQEFEGDTAKIWQANLFGRSFHEIVGDDLQAKASRMPEESRKKLRQALEQVINEGSGGLICIVL